MTFNQRLNQLQEQYSCTIVNRQSVNLAVRFDGKDYPLWPETRTIQLQNPMAPLPREVKQFTESVIDLQEQMGFEIH